MNIEFNNLSFSYGDKEVFNKVSFSIDPSTITCLFGASGKGKTTLLRLLSGLEIPSSGKIVNQPRNPAILFQEDRLIESISILRNVEIVLPKDKKCIAKKFLTHLGLGYDLKKMPHKLSGGMRRRVALARCLAYASLNSDFLLLDEPFSGIDAERADQVAKIIISLNIPGVIITHDGKDIDRFNGKVIEL